MKRLREIIRLLILGELKKFKYNEQSLHKEKTENNLEEEQLEETSTTGGVDGYETPFAFSKPTSDPKNKRAVKAMNWSVVESVDTVEELSPKRKIADAVRSMRNQLLEVEKLVDNARAFKEETGTKSSEFYKRTHSHLRKIGEQLTRVMNKLMAIR